MFWVLLWFVVGVFLGQIIQFVVCSSSIHRYKKDIACLFEKNKELEKERDTLSRMVFAEK
jgi:hypothetical protein